MRRCTGLNTHDTRRQLLEERQDMPALQLTADNHIASRVDAVDLKNRLREVETDRCDRFHASLPPTVVPQR